MSDQPPRLNAANGLPQILGGILLLVALWLAFSAQSATVDAPTCGGKPLPLGHNCVDFTGDDPALGYQELLAAQRAEAPGRRLQASASVAGFGAAFLFLGAVQAVRRRPGSPRETTVRVLGQATGPLLLFAVAAQVITALGGLASHQLFGIPGLTLAVAAVLVALLGGAAVVWLRPLSGRNTE